MKYVVANWKMAPPTKQDAEKLFRAYGHELRSLPSGVRVVVCPPFVWLPLAVLAFPSGEAVSLGAQDAFWQKGGAFTGEVSLGMLDSLGVRMVLVGHSERRALGETNEIVARKLNAVLESGLTALLCVGEQDRIGDWHAKFRIQVEDAIAAVSQSRVAQLMVAYEPVWAIGGTVTDTPDDVFTAALFIRKLLRERFGDRAVTTPVLYGGSVEAKTVEPFAGQEGIDGVLVGHAALNGRDFGTIVRAFAKA